MGKDDSDGKGSSVAHNIKNNWSRKIADGSNENQPIFKLHLDETWQNSDGFCRRSTFGKNVTKQNKTIMMTGATGSGKSTLINSMINYILGVEWEDDFRFVLIDEGKQKSQAESQTSEITAYQINHMDGFRVPYSLTIVDTPGFGDTRGISHDQKITKQIQEFFSAREGIDHIDAVCFVVQASLARLTHTQKYIFDSILSIFGKDIAENILVLVTFADGKTPPVLEAIKVSGVPCATNESGDPLHFKFNNSAVFAINKSAVDEDSACNKSAVDEDSACNKSAMDEDSACNKSAMDEDSACNKSAEDEDSACNKSAMDEDSACNKSAEDEDSACNKSAEDEDSACNKSAMDEDSDCNKSAMDEDSACNKSAMDEDSDCNKSAEDEDSDCENFDQMFWKMAFSSMRKFFTSLKNMQTQSLSLTQEVLKERQHLEVLVEGLQPQINNGLTKLDEIKKTRAALEQHKAEMDANKDFEYEFEVNVPKQIKNNTDFYLTNCQTCHFTCHDTCIYASNSDKNKCCAMKDGKCMVCPGRCPWNVHFNQEYKWTYAPEKRKQTYQELKKRYEAAHGQVMSKEKIFEELEKELVKVQDTVAGLFAESQKSLERLEEIALKPNPLSTPDYIDLMIESEKQEHKPGFKDRIQSLMEVRKKAEIISKVPTVGVLSEETETRKQK